MRKSLFLSLFLIMALALTSCKTADPGVEGTQEAVIANDGTPTEVSEEPAAEENAPEDVELPPAEDIVPAPVGGTQAGVCKVNEYPVFAYPEASDQDWSIGPEDASVTIISYSDFQCPYCSQMDPEIMNLYEAHPDDTRVVFRHFPLSYHELAANGAIAAEYVGDQLGDEAFFDFIGTIFAAQSSWGALSLEEFNTYLKDVIEADFGLVPADFDAILADETYNANVSEDYANGTAFVTGTPFVLMNGIPLMYIPAASFEEAWQFAVDFPASQYTSCPEFTLDRGKQYFATVETTKGSFVMELFVDSAPTTVNSFIALAEDGYFDDVNFHRVIQGFVAQTGDPTGSGIFGPGYEFANEIDPSLSYNSRGIVGMANSGADTNGSQFFITYSPQPALNGGYTIFAYIVEGMDVVESLQAIDPNNPVAGIEPDKIVSITISEE
jgi:cyclophilin family peptidyl-prolyl cis-trans isomerase/protein-disulfide isomerase